MRSYGLIKLTRSSSVVMSNRLEEKLSPTNSELMNDFSICLSTKMRETQLFRLGNLAILKISLANKIRC